MNTKFNTLTWSSAFTFLFLIFISAPSFARGGGGRESAHLLEISAGFVSPSMTTAIDTNAAGLIYNESTKLSLTGNSDDSLNNFGYGGHVYGGNGRFGAGVGLRNYTGGSNDNQLQFGLGGEIESLGTAVGFNGNYNLSAGGGVDLIGNVGFIFNTRGELQIGANLLGVTSDAITAYGLGLAYDLGASARLVVDAAANNSFKNIGLKPGLGFFVDSLQFTASYALDVDSGDGVSLLGEGITAGIGFEFSRSFHLQAYYKRTSDLLATASLRF